MASLIAAGGALFGALITLALLLPANRDTAANRQLAVLTALATVYPLSTLARHGPQSALSAPLQFLAVGIFLLGPGLYLYTRGRINGDSRWRRRDLWHALPCALLAASFTLGSLGFLERDPAQRHAEVVGVLFYLQLTLYLACALRLLYRARRESTPDRVAPDRVTPDRVTPDRVTPDRVALDRATLRWLKTLLGTCLGLGLVGLLFALGRWLTDAVSWPQQLWSMTVVMGMSYLIAFFALLDPTVFHGSRSARREPARYATSSLDTEQAQALWRRLESHMRETQPYLQTQLKVGELATALAVPASHLSQTVNQVGGRSFAAYLNHYRVEAAKDLLRQSAPGQRTMLDIALSAGFNSESVFYKHFRDQVGSTPRQFQQSPPENSP
nr:helix-turn-helix transcriptional regulator [Parahaliea mediterranea]